MLGFGVCQGPLVVQINLINLNAYLWWSLHPGPARHWCQGQEALGGLVCAWLQGWAFGMSPHHGGVDWCLLPAGVGSPLPPWGCRCWGDPWMGVLGLMLAPNKVLVRLGWAVHSWGVMGGMRGSFGAVRCRKGGLSHALVSPHPLTCCDAPCPGSHGGVCGVAAAPCLSFPSPVAISAPMGRPWHTQAPGQGRVPGKPMSPRGGHQPRRATRNTSCIDRGAAIQRGEALPGGGSLSHRCPPPILSHRAGPPDPLETDSISMDTEQHEGRGGGGWERAAGSGGRAAGGARGCAVGPGPSPAPRRARLPPGLSASSAGLCLAWSRGGDARPVPCPTAPLRVGLDPASFPPLRECPSAEPRRPRRGSRAAPEGLKRASASASAGAGWGLSFGKTTGSGGRRMRRPCWPCRTARSRPACRCC